MQDESTGVLEEFVPPCAILLPNPFIELDLIVLVRAFASCTT